MNGEAPGQGPGRQSGEEAVGLPSLENVPATADLLEAVAMRMPFGRFKGERLIDLPEPYVVWFRGQGFPAGALGQRMALVYELKVNGLEKLVRPMLGDEPHDKQ